MATLIAFAGCSSRHGTAVLAEVVAVEDTRSPDDESPRPVPPMPALAGTQLAEGTRYQVPAGKAATIVFIAGIFGVAHDLAEIECNKLRLTKDGNETSIDAMLSRDVEVPVKGGAVTFSQPWRDVSGRSNLTVKIGKVAISAGLGSLFHVTENANAVRVTSVRRAVNITTPSGQLEIGPGQFYAFPAGDKGDVASAAATDLQAQQALQTALADEERIGQMMLEKRKAIPRWRHP